jgi:homoserine dehydrogenase
MAHPGEPLTHLDNLTPRVLTTHHENLSADGLDLRDVTLSGVHYGCEIGTAPVFVLIGGLTADPYALGNGEQPGWWHALAGEGCIDPTRHTVLCPALPGSGTHWASLDDPDAELQPLSVMGLAALLETWLSDLDCPDGIRIVGASLGGLISLATALHRPARVRHLVTVSAGARPDAWGTGVRHLQRELVLDAGSPEALARAMSLARQIGMLTYRGRAELEGRFGRLASGDRRPPIARYLDHHGTRFADRFSARAFLLLSEAIDRFDLGDREAIRRRLRELTCDVVVVGVPQDLLFPFRLQKELHEDLLRVGVDSTMRTLSTDRGHDGFLTDQVALAEILADAGTFEDDPPDEPDLPDAAPPTRIRTVRIGLMGCGVVGQALLELIAQQAERVAQQHRVAFQVVRMVVRDPHKDRGPHAHGIPRTTRALDLVEDAMVDVVVEVAGGTDEAGPLALAALEAGKPFVTANKVLVSQRLVELAHAARKHDTPLACEAAAAAVLPVLRSLSRHTDEIVRIQAIVNGTCNYILTRLEEDMGLDLALQRAQERGFAEADPSADIDGHDAAAKLSLLAYRCFGIWARPDGFPTRGIRDLTPADLDLAGAFGLRVRHVAHATPHEDGVALAVEPVALPTWHLLASVEEEYNAVYLTSTSSGDLAFFGKGAGGLPTATAVLGDLVDVVARTSAGWPIPRVVRVTPPDTPREHLVRVTCPHDPGTSARIEALLRRGGMAPQARARSQHGGQQHTAWLTAAVATSKAEAVVDRLRDLALVSQILLIPVHR